MLFALGFDFRNPAFAGTTTADRVCEMEALAQSVNTTTDDMREALLAYMERRPPTFTGR